MTVDAVHSRGRRRVGGFLLPVSLFGALLLAAGSFVAYVLWPSWPAAPVALDAPALPITVANVLFEVPPASIRAAVQRNPGPHERIDLAFAWPSLEPAPSGSDAAATPKEAPAAGDGSLAADPASDRLFVTVAARGSELPPVQRLRTVYPRYAEAKASAGPEGLAILPFRADTPYQGEDLVYAGEAPERFFARCTRAIGIVPGTCIQERVLDDALVALRFPRVWLDDWHGVAAGFDRLMAQLHPPQH